MENKTLKIKICKQCNLSENETKIRKERHVCNKCRNAITNSILTENGYFNSEASKLRRHNYYEKNKEAILLKRKARNQLKKQNLQLSEN